MNGTAPLARARDELAAARLLAEAGFADQACSRACFAALHAASAALEPLGERPARPAAIVAAFGTRVVLGGGFGAATGRVPRRLLELRDEADADGLGLTPEQAVEVLADAERFVQAVEDWLRAAAP